MRTIVLCLFAGALFGAGLALSGMADPQRVVDFLDVSGNWDPTLLFVMAGALLVYVSGRWMLRKRRNLPCAGSDPVSKPLLLGSAIFGIGWGLGGFCPGPGLAGLGGWRFEALVFVPAMVAGMILAQRAFRLDR